MCNATLEFIIKLTIFFLTICHLHLEFNFLVRVDTCWNNRDRAPRSNNCSAANLYVHQFPMADISFVLRLGSHSRDGRKLNIPPTPTPMHT